VNANQVFDWRKQYLGSLDPDTLRMVIQCLRQEQARQLLDAFEIWPRSALDTVAAGRYRHNHQLRT
jgi:hypothetical protein